ncbi:unnamed protein product [Amoebophrya sp. A120]|nr:unnamed protein product [Amoebophrya sp. A120]|eukprot:GSA120T00008997001.1
MAPVNIVLRRPRAAALPLFLASKAGTVAQLSISFPPLVAGIFHRTNALDEEDEPNGLSHADVANEIGRANISTSTSSAGGAFEKSEPEASQVDTHKNSESLSSSTISVNDAATKRSPHFSSEEAGDHDLDHLEDVVDIVCSPKQAPQHDVEGTKHGEDHQTVDTCTFDLPFQCPGSSTTSAAAASSTTPPSSYPRKFDVIYSDGFIDHCRGGNKDKVLPQIVVDSHGYMTESTEWERDWTKLSTKTNLALYSKQLGNRPVMYITAWGAEDTMDLDKFQVPHRKNIPNTAGWNGLGWGDSFQGSLEDPYFCQLPELNPFIAGRVYPCYETHLKCGGSCYRAPPNEEMGTFAYSPEFCGTMSVQDDLAYMRKVLTWARNHTAEICDAKKSSAEVLLFGQSMGGIMSLEAGIKLRSEGLVDLIAPVSAGAARGYWSELSGYKKYGNDSKDMTESSTAASASAPRPTGKHDVDVVGRKRKMNTKSEEESTMEKWMQNLSGLKVLLLHGVYDETIPPCLAKEFTTALFPGLQVPANRSIDVQNKIDKFQDGGKEYINTLRNRINGKARQDFCTGTTQEQRTSSSTTTYTEKYCVDESGYFHPGTESSAVFLTGNEGGRATRTLFDPESANEVYYKLYVGKYVVAAQEDEINGGESSVTTPRGGPGDGKGTGKMKEERLGENKSVGDIGALFVRESADGQGIILTPDKVSISRAGGGSSSPSAGVSASSSSGAVPLDESTWSSATAQFIAPFFLGWESLGEENQQRQRVTKKKNSLDYLIPSVW